VFRVSGKGAKVFEREAGGHRWQRVPPTEKRGRTQTSTVTVAVLREPTQAEVRLDDRDLDVKTCRGSGAGGQHRNVTDSAVVITHLPTGLAVRCEGERSQHQNRDEAMRMLRARLLQRAQDAASGSRARERKEQVGSGMRGDKIRTVAMQRDQVTDHRNDKRITTKAFLRGDLDGLY
jgi:peptide chain release factor 1